MKSRRILAAVLAPVCALSATAALASAVEANIDLELKYDSGKGGFIPGVGADTKINLSKPDTVDASKIATVRLTIKTNSAQDPQWLKNASLCGNDINGVWIKGEFGEVTKDDDGNLIYTLPLGLYHLDPSDWSFADSVTAEEVNWADYGVAFGDFGGAAWDSGANKWAEEPAVTAVITKVEFLDADGNDLEEVKPNDGDDETGDGETGGTTPTPTPDQTVTPGSSDEAPKIPPVAAGTGSTSSGSTSSDTTSKDDASSDNSSTANTPEGIEVIKAEVKGVDSQKGVEGAALNEQILVKDGKKYTWKDVESVTFTSDKLFCVAFSTKQELAGTTWFTMGKDKVPSARADEAPQWATSWTIGADELALFDTDKDDFGYVKLIAKEDGTDISVTVNVRAEADAPAVDESSTDNSEGTTSSKPADSNDGTSNNPSTGIAIAAAPLALAGAFAVVTARKKRK